MSDESTFSGRDEDSLLAAEYALGVLPEAERETVRARIKSDPALRADYQFWQGRLSSLDAEFAETPAPGSVWPRLESRLFPSAAKAGFWDSLALWRGVAAGALAVAAIAVTLNMTAPRPDPKAFAAQLVAALAAEGSDVTFVALYNESTSQLRLTAVSGTSYTDKDYELWAIKGEAKPESMGIVSVSAKNEMVLPPEMQVDFGEGTVLAVTLEQKGGSPTGQAQGPIVALGRATQI